MSYHSRPEWSRSQLAVLQKEGARTFEAMFIKKTLPAPDESIPMLVGQLTHQQILEPELKTDIVEIPAWALNDDGHRKGAAWKSFALTNEGKKLLKPDEMREATAAGEAVHAAMKGWINHPSAKREHEIIWKDDATDLPLRAKLDLLVEDRGNLLIPDIKTSSDASRFRYEVQNRALWLQHAHYRAAVRAKYGKEAVFWFVVVEKDGINKIEHFEFSKDAIAEADLRYEMLLMDLATRLQTNNWTEERESRATKLSKREIFGWSDDYESGE